MKCFFFNQLIIYKSFYGALLVFSQFLLQGKVLFCMRWQVTSLSRCLFLKRSEGLVEKITGYQTIKCSFLNQIVIYQSFYGTLLTFIYFWLQGKVLCFGRRWREVCSFYKILSKNYIFGSIWHKLFIQMVKYSFPDGRIVYRSFFNINMISNPPTQLINYTLMQLSAKMCNIHVLTEQRNLQCRSMLTQT